MNKENVFFLKDFFFLKLKLRTDKYEQKLSLLLFLKV